MLALWDNIEIRNLLETVKTVKRASFVTLKICMLAQPYLTLLIVPVDWLIRVSPVTKLMRTKLPVLNALMVFVMENHNSIAQRSLMQLTVMDSLFAVSKVCLLTMIRLRVWLVWETNIVTELLFFHALT